MRVLIATHSSLEIDGGEERTLENIARYLLERGTEVRVANFEGRHGNEARISLGQVQERLGAAQLLTVEAMPVLSRLLAVPSFRGAEALGEAMRWADVVVFGQYYGFDVAMFLLGRRFRKNLVASHSNPLSHPFRSRLGVAVQEGYERLLGIPLLRRFDAVRVNNTDDLRALTRDGCRRVLLFYPPNTDLSSLISPEALESPYREMRERLSRDERFKLLIAGRNVPFQKGLDLLGEILLELGRQDPGVTKRFSFLLAGNTNLPEFLAPVSEKFPGLVTNLGVVPREAFPSMLNEVDAVLMPSCYESFGRVAAEAHSLGKPVIATDITGLRDVITNRETGFLVSSWSAGAFTSAILELREIFVSEPERWNSMRTAARARFQGRFGKERGEEQARAFALLLEELARPQPCPPIGRRPA